MSVLPILLIECDRMSFRLDLLRINSKSKHQVFPRLVPIVPPFVIDVGCEHVDLQSPPLLVNILSL